MSSPENLDETPVDRVREMVAGWIGSMATQGEKAFEELGRRAWGTAWFPNIDVFETETDVLVLVDVPGVDPDKIDIQLTGHMLTIKGEPRFPAHPPGAVSHRRERPAGAFSRSVPLPVAVDAERVTAASQSGVLTITLAKEERVRPRHIRVNPAV